VADAQHAAIAVEHGCVLVSRDGDFAAFEPHGLRWERLAL
jgi:predicted nucleic acid-binding protein